MPKFNDIENEFCKAFLEYHHVLSLKFPDHKSINDMKVNPIRYGLSREGICYEIIKTHIITSDTGRDENVEDDLIRNIKDKVKKYFNEKDKFSNSALHWCAIFNYPKVARYLLRYGFDFYAKNSMQLTPMQMATLMGNNAFVIDRLDVIPELTDLVISNKYGLNELHIAILMGNVSLVAEIYSIFNKKFVYVSAEVYGVGNILHLVICAALIEETYKKNIIPRNFIAIIKIIRQQRYDFNYLLEQQFKYQVTPAANFKLLGLYYIFDRNPLFQPLLITDQVRNPLTLRISLPATPLYRPYLEKTYDGGYKGFFAEITNLPLVLDTLIRDYQEDEDLEKIVIHKKSNT